MKSRQSLLLLSRWHSPGVVFAGGCHQHPKKTAHTIIDSSNHYVGALKGNQSGLLTYLSATFQPQETSFQINKWLGED